MVRKLVSYFEPVDRDWLLRNLVEKSTFWETVPVAKPTYVDNVLEAIRAADRDRFLAVLLQLRLEGVESDGLFAPQLLVVFWNKRYPHLAIGDEPGGMDCGERSIR